MLANSSPEVLETSCIAPDEWRDPAGMAESRPVRSLAVGECLFRAGEIRTQLYRVERGALCHYMRWDDGRHEIIEFAFPRDIVGFGHLEAHISTAQAMAETEVSPVATRDFEGALEADGQLAARIAAAADREFEYVRARALESGQDKPLERVASLLASLSHVSAREGGDPALITDDIASGVVADYLHLSVDGLAHILRELEGRGLLAPSPTGLRIVDIGALEKLADAA